MLEWGCGAPKLDRAHALDFSIR